MLVKFPQKVVIVVTLAIWAWFSAPSKKIRLSWMGLVRITSWYPKFNGSHFGLPPSEIHRMTGLPPKIVWTMTYSHRPHSWSPASLSGNPPPSPSSLSVRFESENHARRTSASLSKKSWWATSRYLPARDQADFKFRFLEQKVFRSTTFYTSLERGDEDAHAGAILIVVAAVLQEIGTIQSHSPLSVDFWLHGRIRVNTKNYWK